MKLIELRPHVVVLPAGAGGGRAEIVPTRDPDTPTVVVHTPGRDLYIHSRFDPLRDAQRWAEKQEIKSELGFAFVFGFGLGYHLEALLKTYPRINKLFAVEVSADVFRAALAARDLKNLISDTRVHIFAGAYHDIQDSVYEFLQKFMDISQKDKTDIFIHRPSLDAFPGDSDELRDMLEYIKLSASDRDVFREERTANIAANREALESAAAVKDLFGSYKGRALIVSASGPSLDRSIEILKSSPRAPDIIAVDSALAPFHRAGLRPRFVISGDPQEKTIALLEGLELKEEELIFFPSSNPDVVACFSTSRRRVACSSVTDDEKQLNEKRDAGLLHFSGTVLMAAVDFAVKTGADPILLIGADFSFLDDRTHAAGSRTQGYIPRYGRIREVRGIDENQPVKTSDILYLYKRDLERFYLNNIKGKTRFFNCTARGAAIFHVPYLSLERFLRQYAGLPPPGEPDP